MFVRHCKNGLGTSLGQAKYKAKKNMKNQNTAFTLIEILVVVIILGILAAIVIPQFGLAADDAKGASLASDLQTMRQQLALYRLEHRGNWPSMLAYNASQLTQKTGEDGAIDPAGRHGPYLHVMAANPFNNETTVEVENGVAGKGDGSHGWHFDISTGELAADTPGHGDL